MAVKPIPENYPRVSPYLIVKNVADTMDFIQYVLEGKVREKMTTPDGSINHAEMNIGDSVIMMGKASEDYPPLNAMLYIYVEDTDKAYNRAIEKGATSVMEPANQFYGDRNAGVKDKDGISWWIASHVEDVSQEELQRRNAARTNKS
jgi:PhnB protein